MTVGGHWPVACFAVLSEPLRHPTGHSLTERNRLLITINSTTGIATNRAVSHLPSPRLMSSLMSAGPRLGIYLMLQLARLQIDTFDCVLVGPSPQPLSAWDTERNKCTQISNARN